MEGGTAVKQTLTSLDKAGVDYVVYNDVEPNPKIHNIKEVKELFEKSNADSIITIGGGSAHDTGKGAGIILTNGDDITKLAGIETLKNALPPLIAVNTTAGTGSELTRHAVITNEETHLKFVVVSWRNIPLVSFNDPSLMLDVPKGLTAATACNLLNHMYLLIIIQSLIHNVLKLLIGIFVLNIVSPLDKFLLLFDDPSGCEFIGLPAMNFFRG